MKARRMPCGAFLALAAAFWMLVSPAGGSGPANAAAPHEIPADVIVRAFVRAEDGALQLVLRVPLTSMRDVDFPVRGPGYVDIEAAAPLLADQASLWIAGYVTLYEESARLPAPVVTAARISLPSDPSFADYDRAVAHIAAPPLPAGIDLVLEQAMLDVVLRTPIESAESRFEIEPAWAHLGLRTTTVLRFVTPDGAERVFQYQGNPGRVRLDPRWHQALLRFVALGFAHILDGIDHLLFLLCLVIPLRRFWPLVKVVTAFTLAHSITLVASVMGLAPNALWFPPLIEMLIAVSIVFMALENIVGRTLRRRWMWAFGFGLVHGFGFSFQLRESLQFAGSHLFTSLLGFNLGVELGQLFVLLFMVPGAGAPFLESDGGADREHPRLGAGRPHQLALDDRAVGRFDILRISSYYGGCGVWRGGSPVGAAAPDRGWGGVGFGGAVPATIGAVRRSKGEGSAEEGGPSASN